MQHVPVHVRPVLEQLRGGGGDTNVSGQVIQCTCSSDQCQPPWRRQGLGSCTSFLELLMSSCLKLGGLDMMVEPSLTYSVTLCWAVS